MANKLSPWRNPKTDVSIQLQCWIVTEPVSGQYIEHPRSARFLWNYVQRIGIKAVIRKLKSRFGELKRNNKIAGIGIGVILGTPDNSIFNKGDPVIFLAPNNSPNSPILSLDTRLVAKIENEQESPINDDITAFPLTLSSIKGWSPFSGIEINQKLIKSELISVYTNSAEAQKKIQVKGACDLNFSDYIVLEKNSNNKPSAAIFGLGNYAKTQIVPNIAPFLNLEAIHEIDTDQAESFTKQDVSLYTSPFPLPNESYDVFFIAGYHHTHADIAVNALQKGSYAVIEKPISTTWEQLSRIKDHVLESSSSKFFACFHKRYSLLNEWAQNDLDTASNDPIDMHCIVYEIPLPLLHWYNWPNSGSRIVSNGCHWLDYFMFMNKYSPVSDYTLKRTRNSDLTTTVVLENGAYLSMSLTDTGSQRLGVRDTIELRQNSTTVKMTDGTYYDSENSQKVLRKGKVNLMTGYKRMYQEICKQITNAGSGDSIESIRSTELMLTLEDELKELDQIS